MSSSVQPPSSSGSYSSRKMLFLQKKNAGKVLTQEEANISSRRLARPAKIGTSPRYAKGETAEEYAIRFFKENPNIEIDKREPIEKLDEVNAYLKEGVADKNDRFSFLSKKKALALMIYGENTAELFEAYVELGAFYNDQSNAASAMRNLRKAQQISNSVEINSQLMLEYSVEFSLALLNQEISTKQEYMKQISLVERIITPYAEISCDNLTVVYKRSFILARVNIAKGKTEDAITFYGDAISQHEIITKGETDLISADLYHELGAAYEAIDDIPNAKNSYRSAYDIYQSLEMDERAQELEEWLESNETINEEEEQIKEGDSF